MRSDTFELQQEAGEQAKIDALIAAFYEVISFEEGGSPDWERMRTLFSPHARITRITPEGTDYYDVDGFQEMAKEALDLGLYTRFYEVEVRRDQRLFGGLAHVLSAYETKQTPQSSEPFARGVNSLQLIREGDDWKVLSLFWDEERVDNPLALRNLFETGGSRAQAHA
jgi:hypothetical protein